MEGLKRIAEELQAMRPAMAKMADKLAHYDMQKFLVTLIYDGERIELGVLAPSRGSAVKFVMDNFASEPGAIGSFAVICKPITARTVSPESNLDQCMRFA